MLGCDARDPLTLHRIDPMDEVQVGCDLVPERVPGNREGARRPGCRLEHPPQQVGLVDIAATLVREHQPAVVWAGTRLASVPQGRARSVVTVRPAAVSASGSVDPALVTPAARHGHDHHGRLATRGRPPRRC